MNESWRSEFGKRVNAARKKSIRHQQLTQGLLGEWLNVSAATVGSWENGRKTPRLKTFFDLCKLLEVSADELLGLSHQIAERRDSVNGVTWKVIGRTLDEPEFADAIISGIKLFEALIKGSKTTTDLRKESDSYFARDSVTELMSNMKLTLFSGAIKITDVKRDRDVETKLKSRYPDLLQCIVPMVSLPENDKIVAANLWPEIVSSCAKQYIKLRGKVRVGLSGGTTIARYADLLTHGDPALVGITWVPLLAAIPVNNTVASSANDVVSRMVYNQPGSEGFLTLPYMDIGQRDPTTQTSLSGYRSTELNNAHIVMNEAEQCGVIFLSLGSREYNYSLDDYHLGMPDLGRVLASVDAQESGHCVGDILLNLLDEDGNRFGSEQVQRENGRLVYSLGLDKLQKITNQGGNVWALVARPSKAPVTKAALRAGYINCLVLDSTTAKKLLELEP